MKYVDWYIEHNVFDEVLEYGAESSLHGSFRVFTELYEFRDYSNILKLSIL